MNLGNPIEPTSDQDVPVVKWSDDDEMTDLGDERMAEEPEDEDDA